MKYNILNPPGTRNFPYWPPLGVQRPAMIVGRQVAREIQDIPLNRTPLRNEYNNNNVPILVVPRVAQQAREAAQYKNQKPVMGRGAGPTLMDYMVKTINDQRNQGKEVK